MLLRHDFYYVFQAYKKLPNYINNIFKIIINQLQIIIFFFHIYSMNANQTHLNFHG